MIGPKVLVRARNTTVRMIFIVVLFGISIEMIAKAVGILP
jgi:uncharacterized membrane protein YfcA